MIVTEVIPRRGEFVDALGDDGRDWLRARYARAEHDYVRLNMITSVTGSAAGADGTSESLTSPVDRRILGLIREDADVVLVGAQSVRAEGYILPRRAHLAIATTSGDLRGHRFTREDSGPDRITLIGPAARASAIEDAADALGAGVLLVPGEGPLSPDAMVSALSARGQSRIVCEGGSSLATQFSRAGLIDEYCVSVAPSLEPADQPFLRVDRHARPDTRVEGMLVDEAGFSYLRLRRTT